VKRLDPLNGLKVPTKLRDSGSARNHLPNFCLHKHTYSSHSVPTVDELIVGREARELEVACQSGGDLLDLLALAKAVDGSDIGGCARRKSKGSSSEESFELLKAGEAIQTRDVGCRGRRR
jgi:hypothetical protein